jgi:hypothetical protein
MHKIKSLLLVLFISITCLACSIQSNQDFKESTNPDIILNSSSKANDKEYAITFSIDTHVLKDSKNYDKLNDGLKKKYPQDKNILNEFPVIVKKELTIKDVLEEVAKSHDIVINYGSMSGMSYVNSIDGLAAKTIAPISGWFFLINGELPMTSIDQTKIKDGDKISFTFSVDGGPDIGFTW